MSIQLPQVQRTARPRYISVPQLQETAWLQATHSSRTISDPKYMQYIVSQLLLALQTMRNALEYAIEHNGSSSAELVLQRWLAPTARQIEEVIQRFSELPISKMPLGIEVIQGLTVVVLAADMLLQDTDAINGEVYTLLERNAQRVAQDLQVIDLSSTSLNGAL